MNKKTKIRIAAMTAAVLMALASTITAVANLI